VRTLKRLAIAVGGLLGVLVAALLALPLFLDPNHYKVRVERIAKDATGRELALSGPIKFSAFPWIELEIGPASLGNPPGFGAEPFATLRRATLQVRLLPLLHRHLEFGRIEVDGLDVHLARDARGEGNWELGGKPAGAAAEPSTPAPASAGLDLPALAGIIIRDGRVSYQSVIVDRLDADVGRIGSTRPVPVQLHLVLTRGQQAHPIALSSSFELMLDRSALRIEHLEARLDDSALRGHMAITNLATRAMSFDMTLDQIDLDRYSSTPAADTLQAGPSETAAPSAAQLPATPVELLPTEALRTLRVDGSFTIGRAKIDGVTLTDVHLGVTSRGGLTLIAPLSARLYGGQYSSEMQVDVRGAMPVTVIDESMTGVDVAQLLKDCTHSERLSGLGTVTAHLTARGATSDAMMASLSGHVAANVTHGDLQGIDFRAAIDRAMALAGRQASSGATGGGRTRFDVLAGSADLTDGIAVTRDLNIASQHLRVTGGGTANLITSAIDYKVSAQLLASADQGTQAGKVFLSLPLDVIGTLGDPKVRPDLQAMAHAVPVQQLESQGGALGQKLLGKLKGIFK
jgi:uncharacterized protein involved in outer membrane biogenesis